jgi:hypothetical protein
MSSSLSASSSTCSTQQQLLAPAGNKDLRVDDVHLDNNIPLCVCLLFALPPLASFFHPSLSDFTSQTWQTSELAL